MQYAPTHTDQKFDSTLLDESQTLYMPGRMQYEPTHTGQKSDSYLSDESKTRYVLGRVQYAPTHTDQKFDSHLLGASETCKVFGCMYLRLTQPRRLTLKICMDTCETRRELGRCDQCHANPDELLLKIVRMHVKPAGN